MLTLPSCGCIIQSTHTCYLVKCALRWCRSCCYLFFSVENLFYKVWIEKLYAETWNF
jgi:hypothetical protein